MSTPALELQRRLIRAMSPEQKIRAAEALRRAVWDLKAAWIRSRHPEMPEPDVQDAVRPWFRDDYRDADPERHLRDIAAMRRISGELIDQPALEGWIARLGLDAEWRKALETE
jgi:hypothetical protein